MAKKQKKTEQFVEIDAEKAKELMTNQVDNTDELIDPSEVGMAYLEQLDADLEMSTEPDPGGIMKLSDEHKKFIKYYIEYKNLGVVAELLELTPMLAKDYFNRYSTQKEIRRIEAAMYHRQIATNIVSYEELGRFLSGWLVGTNIPANERLKTGEKIAVVRLLFDWHKGMAEYMVKPNEIGHQNIEAELAELNASEIKELIQKKQLIASINEAKQEKEEAKNERLVKKTKLSNNRKVLMSQITSVGNLTEDEVKLIEEMSIEELKQILSGE